MGFKKYIQILSVLIEGATKNNGDAKKCTRCVLSSSLKHDVFEIPDNKSIGKLFSKYELLFLDQVKSSSDPSEILILQFPIPRASLPLSISLSNFTLAN